MIDDDNKEQYIMIIDNDEDIAAFSDKPKHNPAQTQR